MSPSPLSRLTTLALALALCLAPFARAARAQETRPRRVQQQQFPATDASGTNDEPAPAAAPLARLGSEPTIRVGLATSARSVTISTAGGDLYLAPGVAPDGASAPAPATPLGVARVRVEPRVLAPLPAQADGASFRVEIAAVVDVSEARRIANAAQELTGE
ncbi:MAG TPA: hypothetical protein VF538_17650, partial [Pyrinomonadaceae bacterium]